MNYCNIIEIFRNNLNSNVSVGTWLQLGNFDIGLALLEQNYDWLCVDCEHSTTNYDYIKFLSTVCSQKSTPLLVRIPNLDKAVIQFCLDAGAHGIICPNIKSKQDVNTLVEYASWPPAGKRGVSFNKANNFGIDFDNYYEFAQRPILVGMVEDDSAVNNIIEIASEKLLDAILIGPYDLSASLGIPGDFSNKTFTKYINKIKDTCKTYDVPCGKHIVIPDENELNKDIDDGFKFIPYSIDIQFILNQYHPRRNK